MMISSSSSNRNNNNNNSNNNNNNLPLVTPGGTSNKFQSITYDTQYSSSSTSCNSHGLPATSSSTMKMMTNSSTTDSRTTGYKNNIYEVSTTTTTSNTTVSGDTLAVLGSAVTATKPTNSTSIKHYPTKESNLLILGGKGEEDE